MLQNYQDGPAQQLPAQSCIVLINNFIYHVHCSGRTSTLHQVEIFPTPINSTKIHIFISMSDMKYNAIVGTGIKVVNRIEIPQELVPTDAQVEITAKVYHGYNAGIDENDFNNTKGRGNG